MKAREKRLGLTSEKLLKKAQEEKEEQNQKVPLKLPNQMLE